MRRRLLGALVLVGALALVACTADPPRPSPTTPTLPDHSRVPGLADALPLEEVAAFGAVAMMNAGSNCTGTLIDTGVPAGPAYVLTNGHCVGDIGRSAQTTTLAAEWFGTAEFFRAAGNLASTVTVDVVELAYSTMRGTDTGIVRLNTTLAEIERLGVTALPITQEEPRQSDEVVNVAVPVQGLHDQDWVLRRGDCVLGEQHTVIESAWLWFGVWANDCPGVVQGSSGSPVFSVDTGGSPTAIVAMINTTTSGASASDGGACTINHPCEVTDGAAAMVADTSYAQSVAGVGRCFDSVTGRFALRGGCPLPLSDIWAERGGGSFRGGGLPDAAGRLPEASFVGSAVGVVRTALVPLGDGTACTNPTTYSDSSAEVLPHAGEPWEAVGVVVPADLPEQEGHFLFCAVRGEGYHAAASVLFDVDRTPPLIAADASVEDLGGGAVVVRPHLRPPEITTVRFIWGAPDSVDCDDTTGFGDFFIAPLTLDRRDLPASYCIYGLDAAGNSTPVTRIEIPRG